MRPSLETSPHKHSRIVEAKKNKKCELNTVNPILLFNIFSTFTLEPDNPMLSFGPSHVT